MPLFSGGRRDLPKDELQREPRVSMSPHPNVYARLERVKALWVEISKTPKTSARYQVLADSIRAESGAYLAGVDAARGVDRRRQSRDRREHGVDARQERVERRRVSRRTTAVPASRLDNLPANQF